MAREALPATYDPRRVELARYEEWMRRGYFHAPVDPSRTPYVIMLPLPNVTGELHIGHASTFSVQDVLIRWRRMQGANALWQPGTDHAGIATENVVERALAQEGVTREQLGRDRFVARVWDWKNQYGDIIIQQLRRMGFSCDWDRFVFTLDPAYYDAVLEAFIRLYNEGLIYRGKYMVNWCPRDGSVISDLEVVHEEVDGELWFVRYVGDDGGPGVVIATQRPETILADVAVAVHPDDSRYARLVGKEVIVPIVNRRVPVLADRRVDRDFGTGALKITPGHDPLDYEIGADHGLRTLVVLDPKGSMTGDTGKYAGLDRFVARRAVAEDLRAQGLVEKVEPYRTSVGHCDRCHTVIEPYISDQWFCEMRGLAQQAATAIRAGKVRFHHERWTKVALDWLDNIRPWVISRQLWWGHRIPIWQCEVCGERIGSKTQPAACWKCGGAAPRQDPDVLDTWFSSAIWPFATLGWPKETPDLHYFYPGTVLGTDRGIIFLWVARMIMMGLHFIGDVPFTDVHIAPTVLALDGRRMSKSLGTGIDPLEMADARGYGADAVRFALISRCSQAQQDLRFGEKMIEDVRNFNTKIWNATRFVLMNLDGFDRRLPAPAAEALSVADRWIRSRYARVAAAVTAHLEAFEFDKPARQLYEFIWSEYCDWYLEMAKVDLQQSRENSGRRSAIDDRRSAVQHTLWYVLSRAMMLLHPIMPFITEEVWQRLPHDGPALMIAPWPMPPSGWIDRRAEAEMELITGVVRTVRSLRADLSIPPVQAIPVHLRAREGERAALEGARRYIAVLAKIDPLRIEAAEGSRPQGSVTTVAGSVEISLPLGAVIDLGRERQRLQRVLQEADAEGARLQRRLDSREFLERAPEEVVEREHQRMEALRSRRQRLLELLDAISSVE